jgi:pimeloyl-ACP methyl ester carboxylesterase
LDLGARDARPVILIHGYTDSARDWAPIAGLLTPRFRLIIVDLRGHGLSARPDCCYTRFDFAVDVKMLMDSLHIGSADVVGHSLGSIVAQTLAELWPDSVRRLVLISSTGTSFGATESPAACASNGPIVAGWLASVDRLKDPIDPESAFMRSWWAESIRLNPPYFSRRQRRDAAAIPAHIWRAIADQTLIGVDLRYMLPRIRASTLLIWGELDALADDAGREALRAGIAHAEVRTFAAVGHDLFWEDPSAVATALIGFLAAG